ncbi:2-dehydro-3-deoxy-6-phosphogalactonate aldolase [Galactobacter valiniphilus]|uniref:2-dehydro-3-deoxy-6-phosphogalactonate aldolase n=1 Tax=Galactobacter valiniphilus TaxID=2676122 RepID=A0A399JA32_9MICC|nr:2-dehydro-3-deoxy-6-phosphogalactonate aldolase [Galactobacter valiniphilus]RII41049.1 2-dehydro-3-deoxy-6-phosphogalactonate aldolase [Galactobacter valiniphilus]
MTSEPTGLIAILRGLTPAEAPAIGEALHGAGFRKIEVPLNSPEPLESIRLLRATLPEDTLVGAGTVLSVEDVSAVAAAGGQMVVSPNFNPAVVAETARLGLLSYPGVATASEAFAALEAGATALKLFPSNQVGIAGMKAWASVLPAGTQMLPVGGVDDSTLGAWLTAGAQGAGVGSWLYRAGDTAADVGARAASIQAVYDANH